MRIELPADNLAKAQADANEDGDPAKEWASPDELSQDWQGAYPWLWAQETFPAQWAVLDSNELLDHFETLQCIVTQMSGLNFIVPDVVMKELEGLEGLGEEALSAKHALTFIRDQIKASNGSRCTHSGEPSMLVLQEPHEETRYERFASVGLPSTTGDKILACALYFQEKAPSLTQLLTADCALKIKGVACGIPAETVLELMTRGVVGVQSGFAGFDTLSVPTDGVMSHLGPPFLGEELSLQEPAGVDGLAELQALDSMQNPYPVQLPPGLAELLDEEPPKELEKNSLKGKLSLDSGGESTQAGGLTEEDLSEGSLTASPVLGPVVTATPHSPRDSEASAEWHEANKSAKRANRTPQVVLRGLPFTITEAEVSKFVKKMGVSFADIAKEGGIVLLANAQGRPSGFAEIHLAPGVDAASVKQRLHMKYLGDRYVEALPPKPNRKAGPRRRQWRKDGGFQ